MAEGNEGRPDESHGGSSHRQWREQGDHSWRGGRGSEGKDNRTPRDSAGNRGGSRSYGDRDDRRGGYQGREGDNRGSSRSYGDRDDRRGGYQGREGDNRGSSRSYGDRDDRRGGYQGRDGGDRGGYQRREGDNRGSSRSYGDRDDRRGGSRSYGDRDDRRSGYQGREGDNRGSSRSYGDRDDRRGGYQGRDGGDRGGYQGREGDNRGGGRSYGHRDDRRGGYQGREGDNRGGGRSYGERDDRRGGYQGRDGGDRGGYQRRERDSRGSSRSYGDRDDRRGAHQRREGGGRDDRRGGYQGRDGGDRGGYQRRDHSSPRGGRKDDRQGTYSSTDEYTSPTGDEPTIPAGVSAEELDADALRALSTLSGPNRDIVARHLVMAGQLIDLDAEKAYQHAQAAARRAGRVDVVREAAALTAYASGRYEEALREVRAVRRMRGDDSLRAVEADAERGLGHPEKAVEIIDAADTSTMDLADQVELVLVSSGARADLGENEVGLVLVDDALAVLPEDTDPELVRRLMSVKVDRLRELGRDEEADEVEASIPPEEDDPEIVDVELFADADVDNRTSELGSTETALNQAFDAALMDLDGVAYYGRNPVEHAAESVVAARGAGMATGFITNNASRTPQSVADQLDELGFEATPSMIMTSSMDVIALMKEKLEDGADVLVVGGEGLRAAVTDGGYHIVDSADDHPAAVVQGFDRTVGWPQLSEAVYAINGGAVFFATNLDATLPTERGFALGNGALVRAVQHATGVRPIAAGKPEPGIFARGGALVGAEHPVAVGDRLETDIAGAVAAGIPSMHVLTGVHQARDVILARRGQRPTFLARDLRGLNEVHPKPKHHRDGTWTCGYSQVAKVQRDGSLALDGVELAGPTTVTLDSYRALAAAAWEAQNTGVDVHCPEIAVVDNDDPAGVVEAPEVPEGAEVPEADEAGVDEAGAVEAAMADTELDEEAGSDDTGSDDTGSDDTESDGPGSEDAEPQDAEPQDAVPDGAAEGGFTEADLGLAAQADALEVHEDTPTFLPGEEELQSLLEATADLDDDDADLDDADGTGVDGGGE